MFLQEQAIGQDSHMMRRVLSQYILDCRAKIGINKGLAAGKIKEMAAQSRSLVAYLLDNYGQDSMLRLLELFKQGNTCDEALKAIYGLDMDSLDQKWQRSLATEETLAL